MWSFVYVSINEEKSGELKSSLFASGYACIQVIFLSANTMFSTNVMEIGDGEHGLKNGGVGAN